MKKVRTSNVTDMYGMFLNCKKLREIATEKFDTRNVEIITNEDMKQWLNTNYPYLNNITVVN